MPTLATYFNCYTKCNRTANLLACPDETCMSFPKHVKLLLCNAVILARKPTFLFSPNSTNFSTRQTFAHFGTLATDSYCSIEITQDARNGQAGKADRLWLRLARVLLTHHRCKTCRRGATQAAVVFNGLRISCASRLMRLQIV